MSFTIQDMMLTAETRYEMKFLVGKNGWSNSISWASSKTVPAGGAVLL